MKALKLKIAGGTAALAAVLGGGAVAATQLSPTEESDAIVADAAKQLGVSADKLDAALKQALENRVDAAVEAGTITEAQAAELKERIEAGDVPLVGVGPGRAIAAATTASSTSRRRPRTSASPRRSSERASRTATRSPRSRRPNGKTAAGLVDALVAAAKADLDEKVAAGRLTEAQRTAILADLESRIDDVVNGEFSFGFRGGPGGPPPGDPNPADAYAPAAPSPPPRPRPPSPRPGRGGGLLGTS